MTLCVAPRTLTSAKPPVHHRSFPLFDGGRGEFEATLETNASVVYTRIEHNLTWDEAVEACAARGMEMAHRGDDYLQSYDGELKRALAYRQGCT